MKYKTLLFDADDTLLDFGRAEHAALTDTLTDHGLPVTPEIMSRYSEINLSFWKALERGEIEKSRLRVARFEKFCSELGFSVDPLAMADTYTERLSQKSYTLDGAVELSSELSKHYKMYIVTNGLKTIQTRRFAESGLPPYFEKSFISEDMGFEKPDVRYFERLAELIPDFDKETTLIIGDSLTSDMRGGVNFGIDTCWFNPKNKTAPTDMSLTYEVHSIAEMGKLLLTMKLADRLIESGIEIHENEPLAEHSSFRIGGPARLMVKPSSAEQLVLAIESAKELGVRYCVIGKGSNLLFADAGFDGAVIVTTSMCGFHIENNRITADCGAPFTWISARAAHAGLSGLEFAYGIPGTVGGAVYMNAGAYGGETSQVLVSARVYNAKTQKIETLSNSELEFSYRHSLLCDNGELTVLDATFELTTGDPDAINEKKNGFMASRAEKQPLEFPSAGSTFKRPTGYFAGKLIEDSGLKGYTIGGAQVSEKHAGFVINRGGATAGDVLSLIEHIKKTVLADHGVELECEIKYIDRE